MIQLVFAMFWIVLVAVVAIVLSKVLRYGMRPKGYPPGPRTLPIIGNLHQMPRTGILHLQFQEWAKQYGPIVSLKLGSQTLILLNSESAVKDLLDRKSQNTSARMDMFLSEFGGHNQILMRSNDETWRRQRKMYHRNLNSQRANYYLPYQNFESIQLLSELLESPDEFVRHLRRYATSIGSTMVYGWRVMSLENNVQAKTLFEWADGQVRLGVTTAIPDWYPFLRPIFRRLPSRFSNFLVELKRLNLIEFNLWKSQYEASKTKIEEGQMRPSFCRDMIMSNTEKADFLSAKEIMFNAGHAWAGASDTQFNTLWMFVKAMVLYPDVQEAAHKELDDVVGSNRLPAWEDWLTLPYVRSCMKETLRCYPATLTGAMPHGVAKDDVYMGYTIPAGAGLMNNVWALNNGRVSNPRTFDPLRHIDDTLGTGESAAQGDVSKRDHFTFGAGRRICPGTHVADRGLFLAISRLLWAFEFEPVLGHPIDKDAVTPGFVTGPVPFKCKIKPRDSGRGAFIREQWQESKAFLDEKGDYVQDFYEQMGVKD